MVRFIQIVIGPAGTGKSTYCKVIQEHCRVSKRTLHVANLDPAAEDFGYEAAFDIRDLISLDEVMEELNLGPNGGLVYCMEYLMQNSDWLKDQLENFDDDDYIIFDCPGQVELYSHLNIMHTLVKELTQWGFRCVSVYLLDALYVLEPSKFISGCLLSLSCMMQLELPHINVVTKCDLADKSELEAVLDCENSWVLKSMTNYASYHNKKFNNLTSAMGSLIDDYMMVSFVMLDINEEDSIEEVLAHTDQAIQYGEDAEPREPKDELAYDNEDDGYDYENSADYYGDGAGDF